LTFQPKDFSTLPPPVPALLLPPSAETFTSADVSGPTCGLAML
jgi:hypothetical protein